PVDLQAVRSTVQGQARLVARARGKVGQRRKLDRLEQLGGGRRYVGSGTTHVFCYPTCAQARRITERHRIDFADEQAALAAGYRPCKRCRPALAS
ncbi:MAG: cysteine methyltransferase, partial [bacterium]|nr:cysteine methyltransferase [bacterium]